VCICESNKLNTHGDRETQVVAVLGFVMD